MTMMADSNCGNVEFSSRVTGKGRQRTVLGSDFEYRDPEFTNQAIGNRQKRHQRITPIMKWEFQKDTHKMMSKIRTMKPVVDSGPPKKLNVSQNLRRYREEHEQIRLDGIEKENYEMLDRLRKIHNRPRSTFCHLKRRGDPLVKGDAFRLPPPTSKGNYLVEMYKKFKLSNPMSARKSIRIQQEMLTSALDLVNRSNKTIPSEEMIESEVQSTLSKEDVILPEAEAELEQLSPVEVVQLLSPEIDAKVLDELVGLSPTQEPESSLGSEVRTDTNETEKAEAPASETTSAPTSTDTAQNITEGTPSETNLKINQSMDLSSEKQNGEENYSSVSTNLVESRPFD